MIWWRGAHSGNHHWLEFNNNSSLTVQVFDNEFNDLHVRVIIAIWWDSITWGSLFTQRQILHKALNMHNVAAASTWSKTQTPAEQLLLLRVESNVILKWMSYSLGVSPSLCTHSSTVVWSSASVLASFSLRRLHSSRLRSSSCCRSFKSAADFLSASFFWRRNKQVSLKIPVYVPIKFHLNTRMPIILNPL